MVMLHCHYNGIMLRVMGWACLLTIILMLAGCARDVNDDLDVTPYPTEVRLAFRTEGNFSPDVWYYMVFNFSQASSPPTTTVPVSGVPEPDLATDLRGMNWELYVMLHKIAGGGEELYTLQRMRDPAVLGTAEGPSDVAAGDFNSDGRMDVAITCQLAGKVQQIRGKEDFNAFDPVYFENAEDITVAEGVQPIRLHAADFTGDEILDLLVLYAGDEESNAHLRVLAGDGAGGFSAVGTDFSLIGTPFDWWVGNFDTGQILDLAVLSFTEGTGTVYTYLGALDEGIPQFEAKDAMVAGANPVSISGGALYGASPDLVVADVGEDGNGSARLFTNVGDGMFDSGNILNVVGEVTSAAIGRMMGADDDVVVTYIDGDGKGNVGVFHYESADGFTTVPETLTFDGEPCCATIHDANGDGRNDVLMVDGRPGTENQTLYIAHGDRITPEGGGTLVFGWLERERENEEDIELVTYLTGIRPTRITVVNLDDDGEEDDLLIPNTFDGEGGNSVNLFYGLGKDNYTNSDIYWVDMPPQLLSPQQWYLRHSIGPNFFQLVIDPALFWPQSQQPPESFIVDFMTGTRSIVYEDDPDWLGEIRDHLSTPIGVPITVDYFNDEQNSPRALEQVANDSEDIDFWEVEVF